MRFPIALQATTLARIGMILLVGVANLQERATAQALTQHLTAARSAAGTEHGALFNAVCPVPPGVTREEWRLPTPPPSLPGIPGAEPWRTEPVQVFDNLYFLGQTEYSAWAITTSEGIIVLDALHDYSVEAQIADGLRSLGLDPANIRYAIISHGHEAHVSGAAFLQERFGARVVLSEADWALVETSEVSWAKPRRDIVATDGQEIRLGDVTVTLYSTPGHTPGAMSAIVTSIRDGDRTHTAATWGGTALNFGDSSGFPRDHWLRAYSQSARRFREITRAASADIILGTQPRLDRTPTKVRDLDRRGPGEAHPYVVGSPSVARYLTVAEECAAAALELEER